MNNKYNTFAGRFWAGIIDGLILIPILIIDLIILQPHNDLYIVIPWLAISYLIYFAYSIYFHWKYGQTIGKKATKVSVVDVSEIKGLRFSQALLRDSIPLLIQFALIIRLVIATIEIGYYDDVKLYNETQILSTVSTVWFLLEVVTMLMNDKRRALHDYIANTVVINNKARDY